MLLRLLGDGLETARLAENKSKRGGGSFLGHCEIVRRSLGYFEGMWKELGLLLEEFLFCNR